MVIDPLNDELLSLNDVRRLPVSLRNGKPISRPAVHRWVSRGLTRRDGRVVKLSAILTPVGLRTTRAALTQFIAELNATAEQPATPPPIDAPAELRRILTRSR